MIEEIGRGGMGAVYLVKHLNTGDYLALKLLHADVVGHTESVDRFKREMRLPAKIRSDHVVKITDADTAPELDGAHFLVMELLNGCDLGRVLAQRGARSKEEVLWVLSQIAKALDKAHSLGIVHRDLKPENLFIHHREDESAIVKILDFGIAKLTENIRRTTMRGADEMKQTAAVGTPMYMSPEQAQGQTPGAPPIGAGADIWAIGMMVFELLAAETYWHAGTVMELMGQLMFAELQPPSLRSAALPKNFDAWFGKSCNRDPAKRWNSTSEQLNFLVSALGATGVPSQPPKSLVRAAIELTLASVTATATAGLQDNSLMTAGSSFDQVMNLSSDAQPTEIQKSSASEEPTRLHRRDQITTVRSPLRPLRPTGFANLLLELQRRPLTALILFLIFLTVLFVTMSQTCTGRAPSAVKQVP